MWQQEQQKKCEVIFSFSFSFSLPQHPSMRNTFVFIVLAFTLFLASSLFVSSTEVDPASLWELAGDAHPDAALRFIVAIKQVCFPSLHHTTNQTLTNTHT